LRARTKDSNGMEVGTFNDDTRPTSAQVLTLIDQAVADVQAWLGPNPPPELAAAARVAASLEVALPDRAELPPGAGALAAQRVPGVQAAPGRQDQPTAGGRARPTAGRQHRVGCANLIGALVRRCARWRPRLAS
jgi:hypothetical protein